MNNIVHPLVTYMKGIGARFGSGFSYLRKALCGSGLLSYFKGDVEEDALVDSMGSYKRIKKISGIFNGTTYTTSGTVFNLTGDFTISLKFVIESLTTNQTLVGSNSIANGLIRVKTNGNPDIWLNSIQYSFPALFVVPGEVTEFIFSRVGTNFTCTMNGVSQTIAGVANTYTFNYIGVWNGVSDKFTGNIWDVKVWDVGTLVYHNTLSQGDKDTICRSEVGVDATWVGVVAGNDIYEISDLYGYEKDIAGLGVSWKGDGTSYLGLEDYLIVPVDTPFKVRFKINFVSTGLVQTITDSDVATERLFLRINTDDTLFSISGIGIDGLTIDGVPAVFNTTVLTEGVHEVEYSSSTGSPTPIKIKRIGAAYTGTLKLTSNIWDFEVIAGDETIFKNYLAQGAGAVSYSLVGTDVVVLPSASTTTWEYNIKFGHVWKNYNVAENLLSNSEDISEWTLTANTTVTPDVIEAPDGSLADEVYRSTSFNYASKTFTTVSGKKYVASLHIKKKDLQYCTISYYETGTTVLKARSNFDFDTGEMSLLSGPTFDVEELEDGWFRVSVTIDSTAVSSGIFVYPGYYSTAGEGSIYLWGAQVNEEVLKDYYRTTDSPIVGLIPAWEQEWTTDSQKLGVQLGVNITESPAGVYTANATIGTSANNVLIEVDMVEGVNNALYTFDCVGSGTVLYFSNGIYESMDVVAGESYSVIVDAYLGERCIVRPSVIGTAITNIDAFYYSKYDSSPGKDIFGNTLVYQGNPSKDMEIYGYTAEWNGLEYATISPTIAESIVVSGDFKIHLDFMVDDATINRVLIGGFAAGYGIVGLNTSRAVAIWVNGVQYTFPNSVLSLRKRYTGYIERIGTTCYLNLNDGLVVSSVAAQSTDLRLASLAAFNTSANSWSGHIYRIAIEQQGSILHDWVFESSPTSLQSTIYDVAGGRHATLGSATFPFFTTRKEGSYLMENGFSKIQYNRVDQGTVYTNLSFDTFSADGNHIVADNTIGAGYFYSVFNFESDKSYRIVVNATSAVNMKISTGTDVSAGAGTLRITDLVVGENILEFNQAAPLSQHLWIYTPDVGSIDCTVEVYEIDLPWYETEDSETLVGPELVTNGDFSSGTGWSLSTAAATISDNQLHFDGTQVSVTYASQAPPLPFGVPGEFIQVELDIASISGGSVFVTTNSTAWRSVNTTDTGVYRVAIPTKLGGGTLYIGAAAGTIADINSVSVKKIGDPLIPKRLDDYSITGRPLIADPSSYTIGTPDISGTTYVTLGSQVDLEGPFTIDLNFTLDNLSTNKHIFGGSGTGEGLLRYDISTSSLRLWSDSIITVFDEIPIEAGVEYTGTLEHDGSSNWTLTLNGISQTEVGGSSLVIRYLLFYNNGYFDGTTKYMRASTSSGMIHNWIFESDTLSNQGIIYDVVGGNHGTITNLVAPLFTRSTEDSYLERIGFSDDEDREELWYAPFVLNKCVDNGDGSFTVSEPIGLVKADERIVTGEWYETTFTISNYTGGEAGIANATTTSPNHFPNANGTFTVRFQADGAAPTDFVLIATNVGTTFSDITLRHIAGNLAPARSNGLSSLETPITNPAGQIGGAPVDFRAPYSSEWFLADETPAIFYETDGIPKYVSAVDIDSWTDQTVNNQYFTDNDKKLIVYLEPISGNCLARTEASIR